MKNLLLRFIFTCLLFGYAGVNAQELMNYQQPRDYEMPPKMIPTIRKYWVSLPKDYNETTDRYPIIFLFDGDEQFLRNLILFDTDQLTHNGDIPPLHYSRHYSKKPGPGFRTALCRKIKPKQQ